MRNNLLPLAIAAALGCVFIFTLIGLSPEANKPSCPAPMPLPDPVPMPRPCPEPKPWGERGEAVASVIGQCIVGGPTGPGGQEVQCDLPVSLRMKNVGGSDGAGLCVFTSIMHSARYQGDAGLANFQQQMRQERGGGYPSKVDSMIKKYSPGSQYLQYEGNDATVLDALLASGRMPGVTYNGHDPHYRGSIAHMVNLVYLDQTMAAILDNNYIADNALVWMTRADFIARWTGGKSGWAVALLAPAPAPVPRLPVGEAGCGNRDCECGCQGPDKPECNCIRGK